MDGGLDDALPPPAVAAAPPPSPPPADNKFNTAIAAWRDIDLTALVPQLDTVASDLVAHQRDTLTQRKDLAAKTKDFRKLDDASKLTDIKALLKSYQNFIDLVSTQSKTVQAAFFQLYSPLSEAPDPYPLLEASVDSLVTADEVVPRLTAENERLHKTVASLTAQLETSEAQLDEERSARKTLQDTRDAKIKEVEAKWTAVVTENKDNWEAKEKSLEDKVESQDRLLKELKANYEVSQRLGQGDDSTADATNSATAAELDIVAAELERTAHRLSEVEARNEQLRLDLAQSASADAQHVAVEDDPAFLRLRSENSSLLRKLENARFDKDAERTRLETGARNLEREIKALRSEKDSLREKVQKWSDYDNVKQELDVLKSIEFATGDDDDDAAALDASGNGTPKAKGETLEQLLLARNKKLGNELTVLRVSHNDLQSRLETLQEELSTTNAELEKARALTETLEADLETAQQEASNAFDPSAMSVAGTYVSRYPQSSYAGTRRGRSSPTSSIISGFDNTPSQNLSSLRVGDANPNASSILPMLTAQRDRFKKRNADLETSLAKADKTITTLRSEITSLQKDNLDLYEKTRYISAYNTTTNRTAAATSTTSASAYAANPNPSTIPMPSSHGSTPGTDRYQATYEANLSPFAAFRGRESARAVRRMHVVERAVLRVTKLMLSTRASRNATAAYLLALHVLLFWNLVAWVGGAGTGAVVAGPVGGGGGKEYAD